MKKDEQNGQEEVRCVKYIEICLAMAIIPHRIAVALYVIATCCICCQFAMTANQIIDCRELHVPYDEQNYTMYIVNFIIALSMSGHKHLWSAQAYSKFEHAMMLNTCMGYKLLWYSYYALNRSYHRSWHLPRGTTVLPLSVVKEHLPWIIGPSLSFVSFR